MQKSILGNLEVSASEAGESFVHHISILRAAREGKLHPVIKTAFDRIRQGFATIGHREAAVSPIILMEKTVGRKA